jgi:uncharacterized protein (DUF2062 family)
MLKHLFSAECHHGIGFLASANLAAAGIQQLISTWEPILRTLLVVGQIAVAVATVVYIWKKAQVIKGSQKSRRKLRK